MRMTPEAFHTWSQRLQLSAETEALIATIRASPPVRRPSGRAGNITRRYPSPNQGARWVKRAASWNLFDAYVRRLSPVSIATYAGF